LVRKAKKGFMRKKKKKNNHTKTHPKKTTKENKKKLKRGTKGLSSGQKEESNSKAIIHPIRPGLAQASFQNFSG